MEGVKVFGNGRTVRGGLRDGDFWEVNLEGEAETVDDVWVFGEQSAVLKVTIPRVWFIRRESLSSPELEDKFGLHASCGRIQNKGVGCRAVCLSNPAVAASRHRGVNRPVGAGGLL
jgi:hypothetical protein